MIYLPSGRRELNVKVVVAAFNQEKALVGAFSVIVQLHRLIDLRNNGRYQDLATLTILTLRGTPLHRML